MQLITSVFLDELNLFVLIVSILMFLFVFLCIEVVYLIRKGLLLEVAQRRPSQDNSVKLIINFNLIITSWFNLSLYN